MFCKRTEKRSHGKTLKISSDWENKGEGPAIAIDAMPKICNETLLKFFIRKFVGSL